MTLSSGWGDYLQLKKMITDKNCWRCDEAMVISRRHISKRMPDQVVRVTKTFSAYRLLHSFRILLQMSVLYSLVIKYQEVGRNGRPINA